MRTTSILTATAIALVATVGSASAAERFATLDGIAAAPMSAAELSFVRGRILIALIPAPNLSFEAFVDGIIAVSGTNDGGVGFVSAEPVKPAEFRPAEFKPAEFMVFVGEGLTKM